MTDPLEITLPDTDHLDDGDTCVDALTGVVHIIRSGHWCLANISETLSTQDTLARWREKERL